MKSISILHVFVCLLISTAAFGQTAETSPATIDAEKAQQEIEKKALLLLDETISDAESLKLPENRIYVFYSAAVLLWPRDEKRARQLFRRAANELTAVNIQSEESEDELPEGFLTLKVIRNQFLMWVGNHDTELAIEFVRQTRPSLLNQMMNLPAANTPLYRNLYPQIQTEIALEKQFAVLMIRQNPRRALEIARANLSKGASSTDLNLINQLKTTDVEAASQFANEVLQKIVSSDFSGDDNYNIRNLAESFLAEFSPSNSVTTDSSGKPKQLPINQVALRRLAEKYADYLSSNAFQSDYYDELQKALPLFEKILPERVAGLRQQYEKLHPMREKLNQLASNATPETMVAEAQNFPVQMRPQIYNSAASKAAQSQSYDEARRLLSALPDKQNRQRALLELDQKTFKNYLGQAKYAEAEQIIEQQTDKSQKIIFLVQIGRHFYDKKQTEKALQYVSQAYSMINSNPANYLELSDVIEVLSISAEVSPEKTFGLVESFMPKFNEMLAANALPSKNQECACTFFRDGEFVFSPLTHGFYVGGEGTEEVLVGLDSLRFRSLARVNLERTIGLADKLERRDARLAARLMILHIILFSVKRAVQQS
ncbi:MAG: hypothetical protein ABI954_01875 [Pyrinomonadaceae bacterium]